MRTDLSRMRLAVVMTGALVVLEAAAGPNERSQNPSASQPLNGRQVSRVDVRSLVAAAEARHGPDTHELSFAIDKLLSDLLSQDIGNNDEALRLAERAVRLKKQFHGQGDPANAVPLENLGRILSLRGEYKLAIPAFDEACTLREVSGGHPLADCLESLALAHIRTSRLGEAEAALNRSLRATAQTSPEKRSQALGLRALLNRWAGRYDAARAFLDEAFATRPAVESHDGGLVSLLLLKGDLLWLGGDIFEARETYASAVASSDDLLARGHVDSLVALRQLAFAEDALGNSTLAVALAERARTLGDSHLAPCHDERALILNDLAGIEQNQGDYGTSTDLFEQSLRHKQRCSAANGADVVTPVLNLASVARQIGNFAQAERLYNDVLRSWSERYGPTHPFVLLAQDRLAGVAYSRGRTTQARTQWLRVLDLRRQVLGPEHPDVAATLTKLGIAAASTGATTAAARYLEQSLEIYRRAGVQNHPDQFDVLSANGSLQLRLGHHEAALDSFSQALVLRQRVFGQAHPITAGAHFDLALAQALSRRSDVALSSALDAEDAARTHLRNSISYLPERQALGYAATRTRGLDLAVSIAALDSISSIATYDSVIRSRAVVLDELAFRNGIRSEDSQLADLRAAFTSAKQRLANLSMRSLRDQQPTPAAVLESARKRVDQAEEALAARSAVFRRERQLAEAGLDDVRRALPEHSALVSFLKYDRAAVLSPNNRPAAPGPKPSTPSYVVFVITSDSPSVSIVPLGAAVAIDPLVARWREAASRQRQTTEREYQTIATNLRRRLWDPVATRLGSSSRFFIVPDGAINLVSFGALPSGDGYLQEEYEGIHYLSAERDLLPRAEARSSTGLFAVGGVDFDGRIEAPPSSVPAPVPGRFASVRDAGKVGCEGYRSMRFGGLPGTTSEIEDIGNLWRSAFGNDEGSSKILTGRAASESAVKSAIVGRRIVHLATHGFFLDGGCHSEPVDTRAVGGLVPAGPRRPVPELESPLLFSGLALAGANRRGVPQHDEDDGILTAEEVASLELNGVEWAVLSACGTGLGEIKAGEGVFGLRRAFQIAGAHTVIMSLWSVEDRTTTQWMRALYEARFHQKLDTLESVHTASLKVLRDRRSKGLSTHPFYWAAFVAAGDWR